MRKIFAWSLMLVLILFFAGCGKKSPTLGKTSSEIVGGASNNKGAAADNSPSPDTEKGGKGNELILPESYPKEILPLAADAKIIDIRQNPANKGLEVYYVSDNNVDTLCDYYEGALKGAENLSTVKMSDGYMITAKMDDVNYTVIISKDAMNPNPKYAGKIAVSIILSGLKDISSGKPKMPEGTGEQWPTAELPGIPQLTGFISKIQRENGIVRLEIIVKDAGVITSYIEKLKEAGYFPDTETDAQSGHVEFLAFKDSSMINFSYKGKEQLVFIEYQK